MKAQNIEMINMLRDQFNLTDEEVAKYWPAPTPAPLIIKPVGRPPKGAMWVDGQWMRDGEVVEKKAKSTRPIGRPPKDAVWDSPMGEYLRDGGVVEKKTKTSGGDSTTAFTFDNEGFKIYKRPRGAAKKGCEWDVFKGIWVELGCATTREEAEDLEPDEPTDDEEEQEENANSNVNAEEEQDSTNELCYCHICKYEVLCEPCDLPEDKEGPIVFVPQPSPSFAYVDAEEEQEDVDSNVDAEEEREDVEQVDEMTHHSLSSPPLQETEEVLQETEVLVGQDALDFCVDLMDEFAPSPKCESGGRKRKAEIVHKRNPKRQCKKTTRLIEMI